MFRSWLSEHLTYLLQVGPTRREKKKIDIDMGNEKNGETKECAEIPILTIQ